MKYIAHRGNTNGITEFENKIEYLKHAYSLGHGLEVDIRHHNNKLYFGHDEPQEEIDNELVTRPDVFVHLKDFKSVELLAHRKDINMFWHNNDEMVFTTHGYIWCYPGNNITHTKSIWLCLNDTPIPSVIPDIYGICMDNIRQQ
jgi:hypothetical protein